MSSHHRWLHGRISEWLAEGLLNDEQAAVLRDRYPDHGADAAASGPRHWAAMLIPLIGSVLVGLGAILFFAYNWSVMPKFVKLAIIFGGIVLAHGAGRWCARNPDKRVLTETFHLLGTMLFGAGIWLVAQIYHMDEHFPNAFLLWALGALVLALAMPSAPQAMLAAVLIAIWATMEAGLFANHIWWAPLIYLFALLPLAWKMRSTGLVFLSAAGFMLTLVIALSEGRPDQYGGLIFGMACAVIALASFVPGTNFPQATTAIRSAALIPYGIVVAAIGFGQRLHVELIDGRLFWVASGTALALWCISILTRAIASEGRNQTLFNSLVVASLGLLMIARAQFVDAWLIVLAFNAIVALHGLVLIRTGSAGGSWAQTVAGFLLIGALVAARFTDLFDSLLARALAFSIAGVVMIVAGVWYSKRRAKGPTVHA